MAEEEGLWPVLKWVKRLIDGVLIEDFGETEIEFAWGEDAQIDAGQQAQVLTSYVGAGILTRNEARVKLGQAPVSDPAANVLLVTTGAGPVAVDQLLDDPSGLKKKVTKAFDPEERGADGDARGLAKYNPHHDEKGRFASADGAHGAARRKSQGAPVAQALPAPLIGAVGEAAQQWWNSSNHSSGPRDNAPPRTQPAQSAASAGAPAPDPDDRKSDEDKRPEDHGEKTTIRLSEEYKNIIMDEHPGLTREALATIEEETQPPGTKPEKPAGKGVAGPDITYVDANTREAVTTVQVKTGNSPKAVARLIDKDLNSQEPSSVIAVQAPEGTASGAVRGAIRDFPFDSEKAAGKSIIVIDAAGRILIPLSPL